MGARILLVEDNPTTLRLVGTILRGAGFEVLEATDGQTALERFVRDAPHLVLQDLLLPDMDGCDLARALRAQPRGAQVPILALSVRVSPEERREISFGFDDLIPKRVDPDHLVERVRALLPRGESREKGTGEGRCVLVADDDALQLKLLRLRLGELGYEVLAASDGEEALALLRLRRVDAVLSDCLMPRLDGFRLSAAIRGDPELKGIPVILLTSTYLDREDSELARAAGASTLVVRTPDFAAAFAALQGALEGRLPTPPSDEGLTTEYVQRLAQRVERLAETNASLAQQVSLQAAEMAVLGGIAEALARRPEAAGLVQGILERCLDAGGISTGALLLVEPDGSMVLGASVGLGEEARARLRALFGPGGLLREAVVQSTPVAFPAEGGPAEQTQAVLEVFRAASAVFAPVPGSAGPVGGLLMASQRRRLHTEEWLDFARAVANQVGQAVSLSRAFQRLASSETRYRELVELLPEALCVNKGGRIALVNAAALKLFGASSARDLLGTPVLERFHPDDRAELEQRIATVLATRAPTAFSERRVLRLDGSVVEIESAASPFVEDGHFAIQVMLRDLTERKSAERELERQREQLRQSEKLAAMSELLAGVAHELNNPLAVVIGQAALLRRDAGGGPLATRADKIEQAAERCVRIVRNFLALARQQQPTRTAFSLNRAVEEALELLTYSLRTAGVEVVLELAPDLPRLWADAHQVQQVVVNLVTNAQHAMRQSDVRRLTLRTGLGVTDTVWLDVADTGAGIPTETQGRIFEPFFTTKPLGQGTGLGLSLSLGIAESHGGRLSVESAPGQGARFRLELPVGAGRLEAPAAPSPSTGPAPSRFILVVDDEPGLRSLLVDMLEAEGHRVEVAEAGTEALEKLQLRPFDVVLSDVRMPDLDGPGLYARATALRPSLEHRFVFVTGDTFSPETQAFLERVQAPVLSKPFDLAALQAALGRLPPPA